MEEEGGTESSLLLPAARSLQAATAGNLCCKGRAKVPGRRTRVETGEGLERLEERGGFLSLSLPRYEVIPEDLRSSEQDPRSCHPTLSLLTLPDR